MNIIAIIPARMASSRYPGKPMADILGMPMIGHVYFRARMSQHVSDTYVATCDQEIKDYIESVGGKAVMTADTHERCSDRCAEAMLKIEEQTGQPIDILLMIQGDEPMTTPEMIDAALEPLLHDPDVMITNLMGDLTVEEFDDPNEVKVVVDNHHNALYFSREPIPSRRKGVAEVPMKKQVCIIPFRRDFLLKFNALPPTELEIIESVDMMRLLQHGYPVRMVPFQADTKAVDTPEDLAQVKKLMKGDPLVEHYLPS